MTWSSALKKQANGPAVQAVQSFNRPHIPQHKVDWARLVSLDFETFYSQDYTLSKLSTSEYIRDPRFKAQMLGIKVGNGKTRIIAAKNIRAELAKINWSTHGLLCHNTQFDGFILSHHYGIHPAYLYDTLSMARGLHSNDIGAGLDEVSIYYGGQGKLEGLDATKGVLNWSPALFKATAPYCANDVDEMHRVFKCMLPLIPDDEIGLIDLTCRMFCTPVLKVDIPRVEAELVRELERRDVLMASILDPTPYYGDKKILKPAERELVGKERDNIIVKRIVGSNEKFADLLRAEGVEPPLKISPAWMKRSKDEREDETDKYAYAFAKDDAKFLALPTDIEDWGLNLNDPEDVKLMTAKQARLQALVDVRIAVKSSGNIAKAQRFLTAGADGMSLPVGYAYYRAHTGRWGGQNKMNMQNLERGGELRLSIMAPKGHQIAVQDSGQIECRVNGWLWGQHDLMDAFRAADAGTGRDAYCNFADHVYGREITKADKEERFVGKVCIAAGELVLTDRGLVPINLISKEDRLWDGVEWVTHDGVIDQGIKEVITYDGLTATPDHEVFTEDGRIIPLGQAASEMARLQRTGAEGQSIRFCDDHVVADTPRKRLSVRVGAMQPERSQKTDLPEQPEKRQDDLVSQERAQAGSSCEGLGQSIRRDPGSVQQPGTQTLEKLRWAGDQVPVQDQDGVHHMGCGEPAPRGLQGCGDRPGEQRRELRAGQLETGNQVPTESKQAQHSHDSLAWNASLNPRVPQPLEPNVHLQVVEGRDDGRANLRKVRTFDIANAGPRRRYTVSGKLCLNCVLGLGFQMGAPKLQMTFAKGALGGPPVYFELDKCKAIVNTYRAKNYRIQAGWKICERIIEDMAVGNTGSHGPINWEANTIWLPNGMALKYPDLRKAVGEKGWDEWSYGSKEQRKKIYGGLLCENIVQALARIIVGWQMLQISRQYRVVMTTHDEVVAMPKTAQAQKCLDTMAKWMSTPLPWCLDIPLNCEGGFAANYSK